MPSTITARTLGICLILGLGGCGGLPHPTLSAEEEAAEEERQELATQGIVDPLEDWNRSVFCFNQMLNKVFWHPLVDVYEAVTPDMLQTGMRNLLSHLDTPTSFLNAVLQGEGEKACTHFIRFVINTLFGLGGLVDVAGLAGVKVVHEDFGRTLKKMGIGPGYFLVLPVLGASNTRDALGRLIDFGSTYPLEFYTLEIFIPQYTLEYIHAYGAYRDTLNQIEQETGDPYAIVRGIYYEIRQDLKTPEEGALAPEKASSKGSEDSPLWEGIDTRITVDEESPQDKSSSKKPEDSSLWEGVDTRISVDEEEGKMLPKGSKESSLWEGIDTRITVDEESPQDKPSFKKPGDPSLWEGVDTRISIDKEAGPANQPSP